MEDDTILKDTNGAQLICLSSNTTENPELLENILKESVLRTKEGSETFIEGASRAIHSLYDKESSQYDGIRLAKNSYTKESIEEIKLRVENQCGITLKFKKSRGRQPTDYFKYASISW